MREKRKELGFTQEQMADKLNISLRQYVRIDKEEDLPRRDILNKIINSSNKFITERTITKDLYIQKIIIKK